MRILILANHYPVCSARYYADAFARLGHDVKHLGAPMGNHIWGIDVPERYTWAPDTLPAGWTPDLVIAADSDPAILDVVGELPFVAPKIVVGLDNHVRSYQRPYFDHYFLAHRAVSIQPFDAYTTHLPCGFDPTHFYPPDTVPPDAGQLLVGTPYMASAAKGLGGKDFLLPSPLLWGGAGGGDNWLARPYDVAIVGVPYPQRIAAVNQLRAAGLSVFAAAGLLYEDYRTAYHNARISLCISLCGDVAQRVFETAALGCLVISDACPDFEALQPAGVRVFHPDNLVATVQNALADPTSACRDIAASLRWVQSHTWDTRAEFILDHLGELGVLAV